MKQRLFLSAIILLVICAWLTWDWYSIRQVRNTIHRQFRGETTAALKEALKDDSSALSTTLLASPSKTEIVFKDGDGQAKIRFKELTESPDLRIFVEKVKRIPSQGGLVYAAEALRECRVGRSGSSAPPVQLTLATATNQVIDDQRVAAQKWLDSRCAGFTEDELSLPEQRALNAWGGSADPLWKLRNFVRQAAVGNSNSNDRLDLAGAIFRTYDPTMQELALGLIWVDQPGQSMATVYFNSLPFGGQDAESFNLAWTLMQCRQIGNCQDKYYMVNKLCASGATCTDSIEQSVRAQARTVESYGKVSALADRLNEIVTSIDMDAFRPPAVLKK